MKLFSKKIILLKNRQLRKAEKYLLNNKYKEAFDFVESLVVSKNSRIAYRSNWICGMSLYKQHKFSESVNYIRKSCDIGNYRHNWYNLAMAYVYADKIEDAEEAFKNIYRTGVEPGYMFSISIPGLIFNYIKALNDKKYREHAIRRANELKQMYVGVGANQNTQVQRGLPPYDRFRTEVEKLFSPEKFIEWEKDLNV